MKKITMNRMMPVILLLAIFLFSSCGVLSGGSEPISKTEFLLDTVCTVTLFDQKDDTYAVGALSLCADYEKLLSRTIAGSEVSQINEAAGAPVIVSDATAALIGKAVYYAKDSGGRFDVSIGSVSELWNFTRDEEPGDGVAGTDGAGADEVKAVPDLSLIKARLSTVGYEGIHISGDEIRLSNPQAKLDLGGIAKGFIADKMAQYLLENGVKAAIIDLGGNIITVGEKKDGAPWKVGVRNPFPQDGENTSDASIFGVITVDGKEASTTSIGSSGTYERYFYVDGVKYHHILDPATGISAKTDLAGVTAVTSESVDGEGITTTCILLGSDDAKRYLEERGIPAVLVKEDGTILTTGDIVFEKSR